MGLGVGLAAATFWRRRRAGRAEHVDLYFEDGSMLSFADGSVEAGRLLSSARNVLHAARGP